jgi:CRP-like cAMP-binding protein
MSDPFHALAEVIARTAAPLAPHPETLAALARASSLRHLAKGETLLAQGAVADHVWHVQTGILRFCQIDPTTGDEATGQFFDEGRIFTEAGSYFTREPATQAVEAVRPATVLCLPRAALLAAYDRDHAVERFSRLMLEEALMGAQRRATRLLTLTPDERYRTFLQTRPEVARRVPQYLLASYLGITPEALSRIRGRLVRDQAARPRQ